MSRKALPVFILAFLVFIALAALTASGALRGLDVSLAASAQSLETPALTSAMKLVSGAGEWYVYIPFALLLLIIPRSRVRYGVPASVALVASAGLNLLLKNLFKIPRPDVHRLIAETGYSFPSGHAMNAAAFVGMVAALVLYHRFRKGVKILVFILAAGFILAVGFSRVYLGVHNPSDIVSGYACGVCIDAFIMLFVRSRDPGSRPFTLRNM